MLTTAVVFEVVQSIAERKAQVFEVGGGIDHEQFQESTLVNVVRQFSAAQAIPDAFGVGCGEGADHVQEAMCAFSTANRTLGGRRYL